MYRFLLKDIIPSKLLRPNIIYEEVPAISVSVSDDTNSVLPIQTDLPCWWCRYTFTSSPIGLPIRYSSEYTDHKRFLVEYNLKRLNSSINSIDLFETEGNFCSFECACAFILDNINNPKYRNSYMLLTTLYLKLYSTLTIIEPAPSWQLLEKWGGNMTIERYRSTFKTIYKITPNIKRPYMFSVRSYITELNVIK